MKKQVVLYSSLLATLLADGADLTRAELDRRLQELERSPGPVQLRPGATCYVVVAPRLVRYRFACPDCGQITNYQIGSYESEFSLLDEARLRLPELKKHELNIAIDVRSFCSNCASDKRFFQPITETVGEEGREFVFYNNARRKKIAIQLPPESILELEWHSGRGGWFWIPEQWIASELLEEDELIRNSNIRSGPGTNFSTFGIWSKGTQVTRLPHRDNAPDGWTRIRIPEISALANSSPVVAEIPVPKAQWVIQVDGIERRVPIQRGDVKFLIAFLTGKDRVTTEYDNEYPLKKWLPRLHELLGKTEDEKQ